MLCWGALKWETVENTAVHMSLPCDPRRGSRLLEEVERYLLHCCTIYALPNNQLLSVTKHTLATYCIAYRLCAETGARASRDEKRELENIKGDICETDTMLTHSTTR